MCLQFFILILHTNELFESPASHSLPCRRDVKLRHSTPPCRPPSCRQTHKVHHGQQHPQAQATPVIHTATSHEVHHGGPTPPTGATNAGELHRHVDRMVMQPALKIVRFCDFSPEIMSTWLRGIIAEARNENPVNEPSMTKVSKKSAQTGSDSSNSTHNLRNRSRL